MTTLTVFAPFGFAISVLPLLCTAAGPLGTPVMRVNNSESWLGDFFSMIPRLSILSLISVRNPLLSDGDFTKGDMPPKPLRSIVLIRRMLCCILLVVSIVWSSAVRYCPGAIGRRGRSTHGEFLMSFKGVSFHWFEGGVAHDDSHWIMSRMQSVWKIKQTVLCKSCAKDQCIPSCTRKKLAQLKRLGFQKFVENLSGFFRKASNKQTQKPSESYWGSPGYLQGKITIDVFMALRIFTRSVYTVKIPRPKSYSRFFVTSEQDLRFSFPTGSQLRKQLTGLKRSCLWKSENATGQTTSQCAFWKNMSWSIFTCTEKDSRSSFQAV